MYRLILIEADAAAHAAVLRALADSPLPFAVEPAPDLDAAAATARDRSVDALLLAVPHEDCAIETIGRCRALFPAPPLIVLTAAAGLDFARAALRAGAQDVVVEHERAMAVLSRILLYAIERANAEARRRELQVEARTLEALLDALFAHTTDGFIELDPAGAVRRASPSAAGLIGWGSGEPPGCRLAARLHQHDARRLAALRRGPDAVVGAAPLTVTVARTSRLLELRPLPLALEHSETPQLLAVAEIEADFTDDAAPPANGPLSPPRGLAPATALPPGQSAAAPTKRPVAPAPTAAATRPAALIAALERAVTWRVAPSSGGRVTWGFLSPDVRSAATIARLAAVGRDDPEVALALDGLHLRAWRSLATKDPDQLPARLALELSYGTCASRPHLERYLAEFAALPKTLSRSAVSVLVNVPKGIHVPTLAKTLRALGTERGKPALDLPELDADYRALGLGQLELLSFAIAEIKGALAKDGKAVGALLARAREAGCATLVRGVGGPLADALRSRLGFDFTVDG